MRHATRRLVQGRGDDGRTYTLDIYSEEPDAAARADPGAVGDGMKKLRTRDGRTVNWIAQGRYRSNGPRPVELTSDDPDTQRVDELLARLRAELLVADTFEVSDLRPEVRDGYTQKPGGGPKFIAWSPGPVSVLLITISHRPDDAECRRQLAAPPNPV